MPDDRHHPAAPWLLAACSASVCVAGFLVAAAHLDRGTFLTEGSPGGLLGGIVVPALAATVLDQRPRQPVAWALMASGVVGGVGALGDTVGRAGVEGARAGAVVAAGLTCSFALFALAAALFPDGPTTRLQRVLVTAAGLAVLTTGPIALLASLSIPTGALLDNQHFPAHPPDLLYVAAAGQPLAGLVLLVAVVRLAAGLRGAAPEKRQQVGWFLYGAALVLVLTLAGLVLPGGQVLAVVARLALAACISVAIGRHRLYDLDLVVSRTVAWALLSAVVVGLYAAVVLTLGALGADSRLGVGLGTLTAAVVFQPARRWMQRQVDRRLRAGTAAALAVLEEFVGDLRAGRVDAGAVELVLRQALEQPSLTVGFETDGGPVGLLGGTFALPPGTAPRSLGGLGGVIVAVAPDAHEGRVGAVLEAARLPLEVARLEFALRASRSRLVTAVDAERRRIERDLHDGAQQRLVALGLSLRLVDPLDARSRALVDQAIAELERAIIDLRSLARGIFPEALVEDGLTSAVDDLARRSPVPVRARVSGARPTHEVELTAWFVVLEAVTNAIKHAEPRGVRIDVDHQPRLTVVEVTDDGRGGASEGHGIRGLRDRVEVLGGRLAVTSEHGRGTTVRAELPCASS